MNKIEYIGLPVRIVLIAILTPFAFTVGPIVEYIQERNRLKDT